MINYRKNKDVMIDYQDFEGEKEYINISTYNDDKHNTVYSFRMNTIIHTKENFVALMKEIIQKLDEMLDN